MEKAFEKQAKTTENQGEKQVKALEDLKDNEENHKKQLANARDYKNELLISKEREIFKNIYNKRLDKIKELDEKINCDNLKFITVSSNTETDFSSQKGPLTFLNDIKTNEITLEQAKASQEDFNKCLKMIGRRKKLKSKIKHWQILIFFLMEEMILSNL